MSAQPKTLIRRSLERYFDYNGIFEGGRLVEACSWLDSIPTIGTPQRIPDNEHIRIKEVIYDALRQAQLEDYAAQVIARLKIGVSVSHRERLGEIVKKYYQGSDDRISEVIDVAARAFKERLKNLPLLVLSSRLRAATEGDPADAQAACHSRTS